MNRFAELFNWTIVAFVLAYSILKAFLLGVSAGMGGAYTELNLAGVYFFIMSILTIIAIALRIIFFEKRWVAFVCSSIILSVVLAFEIISMLIVYNISHKINIVAFVPIMLIAVALVSIIIYMMEFRRDSK